MIPKAAINKAIEGGWDDINAAYGGDLGDGDVEVDGWKYNWQAVVFDPTFWQALGKTLGWEKYSCGDCYKPQSIAFPDHIVDSCFSCLAERDRVEAETWRVTAQLFYNLILTNENTEKFWTETFLRTKHEQ